MKKRGKVQDKSILEHICEFDFLRAALVFVVASFFVVSGWFQIPADFNRVLMINIGYLFYIYIVLTIAYNLSQQMPIVILPKSEKKSQKKAKKRK